MNNSKRLRSCGFTLIEMLLVLVLIGVLSGAVVSSLAGRSEEARVTRAQADISSNLALALDLFEQDVGRYPSDDEGLRILVENRGVANWKGPYVKGGELKPDPWGHEYVYSIDAENERVYMLRSVGPDGQEGTEDDVIQ